MIKHIVFWRLDSTFDAATKEAKALEAKQRLEALAGQIPALLAIEVGINFNATDGPPVLVGVSPTTSVFLVNVNGEFAYEISAASS